MCHGGTNIRIVALSLVAALVSGTLAGCDDDAIPHDRACAEQAIAWCTDTYRGGSGCFYAYAYGCHPSPVPAGAPVPSDDQDACLDAMAAVGHELAVDCAPVATCLPGEVPAVCRALWATQGRVKNASIVPIE